MHLLIIGSLNGQIGAASKIAMQRGGVVSVANDINEALEILRSGNAIEIVMIDVQNDVAGFINSLKNERINVPVVGCGVSNDSKAAVAAIRAGAKEYIPLPPDAELIGAILSAVSEESHSLIFQDEKTKRILDIADKISASEASILVTGESGTGKEVFSRYIHSKSKRSNNRFVAVNCAAIPENLLESELFGYEKGAFTGAVSRRIGKFEEANNGTLLLDEISEMDVKLQAKLLRVLQEKEIDRIGGKKPVKVNVRIIATSNRDMMETVKAGLFREDLFYRLNVVNLELPPLRERPADIKILAEFFVKKYAELNDVEEKPLSAEAIKKLKSYDWPGNVRELENTIHRAVLMSIEDEIEASAVMINVKNMEEVEAKLEENRTDINNDDEEGFVGKTLETMERNLIIDTLKHTFGNRTHAANILGISIRTLRNKLRQYQESGLEVPAPNSSN